jgi:hypothetical protein
MQAPVGEKSRKRQTATQAYLQCRYGRQFLLRSSLVSRHTTTKGQGLEARARKRAGSVQARTVGITALGVERVVADKAQTHCPRLEGLAPWVSRTQVVKILMNSLITGAVTVKAFGLGGI